MTYVLLYMYPRVHNVYAYSMHITLSEKPLPSTRLESGSLSCAQANAGEWYKPGKYSTSTVQ